MVNSFVKPVPRKILVFTSALKENGGFSSLIDSMESSQLKASICAVVSNEVDSEAFDLADQYGITFELFEPGDNAYYKQLQEKYRPDLNILTNWDLPVVDLDPRRTINFFPAPLPDFHGQGMRYKHIYEAVLQAFLAGKIAQTEACIHFVLPLDKKSTGHDICDKGPIIFRQSLALKKTDSLQDIVGRASNVSRGWYGKIANMVLNDQISWDGVRPESLKLPSNYFNHQKNFARQGV